jgi:nitrogen fixation/metabolism regulation signal transduction histidine kinase
LYYWDVILTPSQAEGLSIDLRDLSIDMQQDLHVYSLTGELLASSSPELFDGGVLSRSMSMDKPFFSDDHIALCYEQIHDLPYLIAYLPFHNGAFVTIGYIAVPYYLSEQTRKDEVRALLVRLVPTYLIALLLSLVFSYFATRSITAPISMLTDKMRQFEIGGKNNHIDYPYHDELGALVERYNILVDQVEESAEKLANAEREGAWRTMARQIAHEINNPLTPMKLSVQKLQLKHGTDQFDAYFDKTAKMLIEEIDNLAHIAQSFSTFAKQPDVVTTEVDIARKLSHVITLQRENDEQIPIRYVGADEGVIVRADKEQISQVFVNILRNALQASPTDIIVMLNTNYSEREVQISISDDGTGIPEDIRARIFRPNFTTKSNGNGLGLAISRHIVEGSRGRIEFETSPKGTTFHI